MKKNIGKQLSGFTVSTGAFLPGLGSGAVYAEDKAGITDAEGRYAIEVKGAESDASYSAGAPRTATLSYNYKF